jgi:hypothetical protein
MQYGAWITLEARVKAFEWCEVTPFLTCRQNFEDVYTLD